MSYRILCPKHHETTPSCVIYEDRFHCFGCGAGGPLSEIGLGEVKIERQEPENLLMTTEYIRSLPERLIRGLKLPVDDDSYYVLWPDSSYYKRRLKTGSTRYVSPRGHSKPLFIPHRYPNRTLAIVEGEINALSLATLQPPFTICSPGSASDLNSRKYFPEYYKYDKFIIVADADTAGLAASINLKETLLKKTHKVRIMLLETDFNDLLTGNINELRQKMQEML